MGNKPRIRFKGFTEDWEQCKLGDLLILLKDGSHGTHKNTSEGVYLLSAKNIKNGRINIMPDDRIISWDDYNVIHKNYELQIGDILLTIVGSIGETAIYNLKMKITFQRSVAFLRPNSKLKNGFLYTLINTDRFQNQLQTKQVVSAQPGIYLGDLASINITYPKNVSEQEKIYNIFKGIEDSITLHQCKLEKLKLTKKALLQKLFPKNGEHIPEIRFKGFTDAWEQRKFSDITYLSGIKNKENKPYESYSISNEFGFIPQDEQFENGGTMKTADKSMYYIVSQNSFAYNPARINVGSIGYYDRPDNVIVSSLYEVFKTTDIVNDKFLWHWFKSNQFNRLIEKYQEGGVRLYFYYDKLCKGTIELPAIKEQNKISNLLDDLDIYITLHQQEPFLCGNSVNSGVKLC